MKGSTFSRGALIVCVLAGVGGVLSAQEDRTRADVSGQNALLGEVRALRSEINQAMSNSIRAQLFVSGLQLQEQRVFAVGRQLGEAQRELAEIRLEISGEEKRMGQLRDTLSRVPVLDQTAIQQAILASGAQIDERQGRAQQIESRETELLKAVDDAQLRWAQFNAQLDALERSLPAPVSR